MFSNAVLIKETNAEKILYMIIASIKECTSNHEEYVTFKFDGASEEVIFIIEKLLKKLQYSTFLCYHIYNADTKDTKKCWYLKVSWNIFKKEREVFN